MSSKKVTIAGRFFRRFLERLLRRNAEGPDPPQRIRDEVAVQVLRSRTWTVEQWAVYAAQLAEVSYRDGYLRGYEAGRFEAEGIEVPRLGRPTEEERRNWTLWEGHPSSIEVMRRRGDQGDPLAGVSGEDARELMDQFARHQGTYGRSPGDVNR